MAVYNLSEATIQKATLEYEQLEKEQLFDEALKEIAKAAALEPNWPDGLLKKATLFSEWARFVRRTSPANTAARQVELEQIDELVRKNRADQKSKKEEAAKKRRESQRQHSEAKGPRPPRRAEESPALGHFVPLPASGATAVDIRAQAVTIESKVPETQQTHP